MLKCSSLFLLWLTSSAKTHAAAPNVYALPPIDPPLVRSTPQTAQPPPAQNTQPNDMHRLDALVAAATSDAGHR